MQTTRDFRLKPFGTSNTLESRKRQFTEYLADVQSSLRSAHQFVSSERHVLDGNYFDTWPCSILRPTRVNAGLLTPRTKFRILNDLSMRSDGLWRQEVTAHLVARGDNDCRVPHNRDGLQRYVGTQGGGLSKALSPRATFSL